MSIKSLVIVPFVILAVPVASGCGGDDNEGDSGKAAAPAATETQPATQGAGSTLTVRMTEYAFDPKNAVAKAGKVTISAPNDGKVVHELVVLKTNADPAKLPMDGDEVGTVTSPVVSPRLGTIALAVLDTASAADGEKVEAGGAVATVAPLSVFDPNKERPRV